MSWPAEGSAAWSQRRARSRAPARSVKTDRLDAEHLARLLLGGKLCPVRFPARPRGASRPRPRPRGRPRRSDARPPSEATTGEQRRLGSITKTGSNHARQLLIETGWHYRHRPQVGRALAERQRHSPAEAIANIARLDADVLSIEASRSDMEVLDAFAGYGSYPNDIGPGVYDIHSTRVPDAEEIERLLAAAEARVGRERLWVNPDCGLKTRRWEEALPALEHMVAAAQRRRAAPPGG